MTQLKHLIHEIHRRSIWQVLGVYLAMSWGVLNGVDVLTGFAGLPDWTPTMALVLLLLGLPIVTATAVIQRGVPGLTNDPHEEVHPDEVEGLTPADVHEVREAHSIHKSRLFTWRNAVWGGVMAGTLLVATVVAYLAMWTLGIGPVGSLVAQGVINESDAILLAEFENRTDDASLGSAVTDALSIDLGESDVVRIAARGVIERQLGLMGRDPGETLTVDLAREVAEREGIKALIEGEVSRVGSRYLLAARIVVPTSGDVIAQFREQATDDDDLLPAIDRLSARLRERVGESLRTIRAGAPLAQVTTGSIDALRKLAEAESLEGQGNYTAALQLLSEAVAIDPGFAMAYRKIAVLYYNVADRDGARAASVLAYENRERLTERERYLAVANYHDIVTGNRSEVIAAYEATLRKWPDDVRALNNLSVDYGDLGRVDEAIVLLERAVSLPDRSAVFRWNLMRRRLQAGDLEGSAAELARYVEQYPDHIYVPWARLLIPYVTNDRPALHKAATGLVVEGLGPLLISGVRPRYQAHMDVLAGDLEEARTHFGESRADVVTMGRAGLLARVNLEEARLLVDVPFQEQEVLAAVSAAYDSQGWASTGPSSQMRAIAATARSGDSAAARARLDAWSRESPYDGATRAVIDNRSQAEYHVLEAEGDFAGALSILDAIERRLGCVFCPELVQGRARILAKDGQTAAAIEIWESERDRPITQTDLGPLRPLVAAINLAPLYEAAGDTASALASHEAVVGAWAAGDAALQPAVRRARERIAALGGN